MPASAVSSGKVTRCSISSGDRAGEIVVTWTWRLVMSGTASTGSLKSSKTPHTATASARSRTTYRRRTAKATIQDSIA
jgi:hypothetical protein